MRDNLFDNFIKQKINDHSSAVPGDMWQKILNAKESKRRFVFGFWQYIIGGAFIISSVIVFWKINSGVLSENDQIRYSSNANTANHKLVEESNPHNKVEPSSPKPTISSAQQRLSNNSVTIQGKLNDKSINEAKLNDDENTNTKNVSVSQRFSFKNKFSKPNKNVASVNGINTISTNPFNSLLHSKQIDNTSDFRLKYPWQQDWYTTEKQNTFQFGKVKSLIPFNTLYLPKIDCPKANDPLLRDFNIELYASPDWVTKNTTANKPVSKYYLARKDSSETNQASFTAGIRISKAIGENMVFKTGVQYSQINSKFSYKTENERKLTTVITSRVIIRSPGDTVVVRDTSITEQIGYSVRTSYKKISSIDIPILLGYEWSFNDWKIGLNAGPIINISSWQKGEILDTSFQPLNLTKSKAVMYKKNMGLALFGSLSIIKNIGEKTSIFAEPYFRYNLSSITTSASLLSEKYKVAGLLLGVRYNLSKAKATH